MLKLKLVLMYKINLLIFTDIKRISVRYNK